MNPIIKAKIDDYPKPASTKFYEIRDLIFKLAEHHQLGKVEETLKWGQPSYICKSGCTIRLDWQSKYPHTFSVFFNCKTVLIETFKEILSDSFEYDGNRVLRLPLDQATPQEIEICLLMALNYHKLKNKPLLGA